MSVGWEGVGWGGGGGGGGGELNAECAKIRLTIFDRFMCKNPLTVFNGSF